MYVLMVRLLNVLHGLSTDTD